MRGFFVFVMMSFAAYRVTRLIMNDVILDKPRSWIPDKGPWRMFITCPWCVGSWISFATVLLTWRYEPLALPGLQFLAVATLVGLTAGADRG